MAFLDVSGMATTKREAREIARRLRARAREEAGLPITVGAGRTKIVAKTASRAAKPHGMLVVAPRDEAAFLHPLRVEQLWGIGPATTRKLHDCGLRTVGQVAQLDEATLIALLGTASGRHVHALAHNIDCRPVQADRPPRSFGAQRSLRRTPDIPPPAELDATLERLAGRVTRRMVAAAMPAIERAGLTCIVVTVANLIDISGGVQLELPGGPPS